MQKTKSKKVASDLIYTVMASVVINVVLQLIIYPIITRKFGENVSGEILYFIGIIYIIPQAIGTSINSGRLLMRKMGETSNGDYAGVLTLFSTLGALICGAIAFVESGNIGFTIAYAVFSLIYALRMYAQVEFRLKLQFARYFLYYAIVSVGYLIGFGIYLLTNIWLFIFLCGEILALLYSLFFTDIFKPEKRLQRSGMVYKQVSLLMFSTLVRDGVNQFDKVILHQVLGAAVVTEYNAVSVISKTVQMLVGPVNTLILSYLTVKDAKMNSKQFKKYVLYGMGAGVVAFIGCLIGTPIYLKLFYTDLFDQIIQYSFIVNLGLLMGFIASLYMAILLSQGETVIYTVIQCVWGAAYIISAYCLTGLYSLWGLAVATLICNILKNIAVIVIIFYILRKKEQK